MKPFDLERAKAGAPVITRCGFKARFAGELNNKAYPLCFFITDNDGEEDAETFTNYGGYDNTGHEHRNDLFMAPIKKEGWVNIYHQSLYRTREAALNAAGVKCIDTIRIEWEE